MHFALSELEVHPAKDGKVLVGYLGVESTDLRMEASLIGTSKMGERAGALLSRMILGFKNLDGASAGVK